MANDGATGAIVKAAKLDSQTIVHLILLSVIAWLIFIFVPNLMQMHQESVKEMSDAIRQMSDDHKKTMDEMSMDHKDALQDIVSKLDALNFNFTTRNDGK